MMGDKVRTDNINRHMQRVHPNKSDYVGYKPVTSYTFSAVGVSHPDLFFGQNKAGTCVGYCTKCYTGFHPENATSIETALKRIKEHVCSEKQVRTRKVTVKAEDVSGNMITKTEMQTGVVKVTEEMLREWKNRNKWFEILTVDESMDYDILGSIKKAVVDSHQLYLLRHQMKQETAVPVVTAAPVTGDMYLQVMQSFLTTPHIGEWMSVDIKAQQDKLLNTHDYDSESAPPEPNYREALRSRLYQQKRLEDRIARMAEAAKQFDRKIGELEDAANAANAREAVVKLQLQQECQAAARREAERDEEIRKLRAALQQCQSKIELVVDDKKF
jgi:hypothetical protein